MHPDVEWVHPAGMAKYGLGGTKVGHAGIKEFLAHVPSVLGGMRLAPPGGIGQGEGGGGGPGWWVWGPGGCGPRRENPYPWLRSFADDAGRQGDEDGGHLRHRGLPR